MGRENRLLTFEIADNNSIHVICKRPQNPGNSEVTLEAAMTAQVIV